MNQFLFFAFILAQSTDLSSEPAEIFKWTVLTLLGILLIVAVIYAAFFSGRKPVQAKIEDDPPITIRKAPKRYNHEAHEQRFMNVEARLGAAEAEIDGLWTTMRAEDKQTRDENAESMSKIQRSLGRIEGRLGIPPTES